MALTSKLKTGEMVMDNTKMGWNSLTVTWCKDDGKYGANPPSPPPPPTSEEGLINIIWDEITLFSGGWENFCKKTYSN